MKSISTFRVIQLASMENCFDPDYKQGFIALDYDEKLVASWDLCSGIHVQEKFVTAATPTKAIIMFQRWLRDGLSDSYLRGDLKAPSLGTKLQDCVVYNCFKNNGLGSCEVNGIVEEALCSEYKKEGAR